MIGAADAGIDRPHALADFGVAGRIGAAGEHVDDCFGMVAVAVRERANHRQLVGVLGKERKIAAEREAGDSCFHFAGDAGIGRGRIEVRVERLDMAGSAAEKQQHDRSVADEGLSRDTRGVLCRQ